MSRKVFASSHLHVLEKFSSFVATHGFHTSHSFPTAEYIAEYYSESDRESLSTPVDTRRTRINLLGAKNPEQRRCYAAHDHATTASKRERSRASLPRRERDARRDDRWLVDEANSLNGRAMCAVAAVTGGLGRTRAKSAALGRLRRAGVGRAVYPWRHIIRVNTK